ncbi:MAG: hypothetical protein V3V28_12960 [Polaribacter sp.]|uniref:hypothetical protein n=1 Tax=Polaribacter sp. TaxID=1920175 RepID=UPI002F354F60
MKKANALTCAALLLLLTFNYQSTFSQDIVALNTVTNLSSKSYAAFNSIVLESATLEDGKYTYDFKEKKILVEIKNGFYNEYHPEKEYIKAKIDWITKFKYKLTIISLKKKNAPLKVGSILNGEIIKIKGNEYFYTILLNNKTGKGSFKKVN